jgi:hypothetical protein
MAKSVKFSGSKKHKAEAFPFGMNVMSKKEKSAYRKRLRKAGHSTGGGS